MDLDELFSQESLKKMRSLDNLDTLLKITTPVSWIALAGAAVFFISVVVWSFMGSFTEKVDGVGIIADSGGIVNVTHSASGIIDKVYVYVGKEVKRGDLIAHVHQPVLSSEAAMEQNNISLANNASDARNRATSFDTKAYQAQATENIYSSFDGVIGDIFIREGTFINAGSLIVTIRCTEGRNAPYAIIYVPAAQAKRIDNGMVAQLQPNSASPDKVGSLVGVVDYVSQYPAPPENIRFMTGNEFLTSWIPQQVQGPVCEVHAELIKDDTNPSGFLWTSIVGEKKPVTAGSYTTCSIIIKRQPPIERIFYKISDWLNNR